ncbi:MAG: nucleotide exchange factor GrpE [Candidatus Poribacteria bacterium]|nr:nucleotide exchange factor GrpE [Candidatus Poribacteria bacterium]
MSDVKKIYIETEIEPNQENDPDEPEEKTFVARMREIAETALDTIKSEVKKEIEAHIAPVEETAANLSSKIKEEVAATVQRVHEQYETEREALFRTELEKEVEAAVEHVHEAYKAERDLLLRTAAEAENTKKRMETDYQRKLKYANEEILEGMVPVLDSLEAAIKSATEKVETDDASPEITTFSEGVELVHKQLLTALSNHGLIPIEAVGKTFDPYRHEALMAVASDEIPEGEVMEEFRRGYMLHTRVLRASQVVVSQGPTIEEVSKELNDKDTTDEAE